VVGAVHPRRVGVQVGEEPATVQMPPRPFLAVVIDRQFPLALRAGEASSPRMLRPHIHPPIGHRQLDPAHFPRGDQTQQMLVQLGVTHPEIMPLTP
jgi:hypothetical protein